MTSRAVAPVSISNRPDESNEVNSDPNEQDPRNGLCCIACPCGPRLSIAENCLLVVDMLIWPLISIAFAIVLASLSCAYEPFFADGSRELLGGEFPTWLGWLRAGGGCAVVAGPIRDTVLPILGAVSPLLILYGILYFVILAAVLRSTMQPSGWSLRMAIRDLGVTWNLAQLALSLGNEFTASLALVTMGPVAVIVTTAVHIFVATPVAVASTTYYLPAESVDDVVRMWPHLFTTWSLLKQAVGQLDDATDLSTAMTIGFDSAIGRAYWILSLASMLHHSFQFATGTLPFRTRIGIAHDMVKTRVEIAATAGGRPRGSTSSPGNRHRRGAAGGSSTSTAEAASSSPRPSDDGSAEDQVHGPLGDNPLEDSAREVDK